jgi:hypothetical protein
MSVWRSGLPALMATTRRPFDRANIERYSDSRTGFLICERLIIKVDRDHSPLQIILGLSKAVKKLVL